MTDKFQIHDIEIENNPHKLSLSSQNSIVYLTKNTPFISNEFTEEQLNIAIILTDSTQHTQLRELCRNPSFHTMVLNGLPIYNGLNNLSSVSLSEDGGKVDQFPSTLSFSKPLHGKTQLNWGEQEYTTDWDTYIEEDFDGENIANLETEGWWFQEHTNNDWTITANELEHIDNNAEGNSGNDFICAGWGYKWYSDVDVSADVTATDELLGVAGIFIRCDDDDITHTTQRGGYYVGIYRSTNINVYIYRDSLITTVLRSWLDVTPWVADEIHNLRVRAVGDRIDIWLNGECLTTKEPVIDNLYSTGYIGVWGRARAGHFEFDNFKAYIAKPTAITTPAGALELNKYYEDSIETAEGLHKKFIGSRQAISFDERSIFPSDESLVLDLRFNEGDGTIVYDHSGYDNDGTVSGAIWTNEQYNSLTPYSMKFDGVNDYIDCGDSDVFSFSGAGDIPFTIEMIFKIKSDTGTWQRLLTKDNGAGAREYDLSIKTGLYPHIILRDDSAAAYIGILADDALSLDTLYHLIATYDGTGVYTGLNLYIDGSLIDSSADNSGTYVSMENLAGTLRIGRQTAEYFDGSTNIIRMFIGEKSSTWIKDRYDNLAFNYAAGNEVKVYDVPKNSMADGYWDDTVLWLKYSEGAGTDVRDHSKNALTVVTANIAETDWVDSVHPSHNTALLYHDTPDTAVYVNNETKLKLVNGDWSYIIRFKTTEADQRYLVTFSTAIGVFTDWMGLYVVDAAGFARIDYNDSVGSTSQNIEASSNWIDGLWHEVIITHNGTSDDFNVYRDGNLILNHNFSRAGNFDTIDSIQIGGLPTVNGMDITIDEFRLLKRELTATEVGWFYNNAPRVYDESLWQRVYHHDHEFEGWMTIDNGLIRYHERGFGASANLDIIKVWNGYWNYVGQELFGERDSASTERISDMTLTSLTPYQATFKTKVRVDISTSEAINEYIIRSGLPIIEHSQEWMSSINSSTIYHYHTIFWYHYGSEYLSGRYNATLDTTDLIHDMKLGVGGAMDTTNDNFQVWFSPERDFIMMMYGADEYQTSYPESDRSDAGYMGCEFYGEDYTYGKLKSGIAILPFPTDGLRLDSNNYTDGGGTETTNVDGNTASGTNIELQASGDLVYNAMGDSAKAGAYRIFYRLMDQADAIDFTVGIYNTTDGAWEDSISITGLNVGAYAWYYVDCIISTASIAQGDTMELRILSDDGADDDILIDQLVAVPISNGFDMPLDIAHQALRPINLERNSI